MGRSIIAHLVIIQAFTVCVMAWAGSDRGREPNSLLRLDAREQSKITLRGSLRCPMPETNTGAACGLQIATDSGEVFRIQASTPAMRLYQDGKIQVVATGVPVGDSFRVINIRPN